MNYPLDQKHICFVSGGIDHATSMAGFVQMFLRKKVTEIIVYPHTLQSFIRAHGEKNFDIVFASDSFSDPPMLGSGQVGEFLRNAIKDPKKPLVVTNIRASSAVPFSKLGTGLIELNNISATVEALLAAAKN